MAIFYPRGIIENKELLDNDKALLLHIQKSLEEEWNFYPHFVDTKLVHLLSLNPIYGVFYFFICNASHKNYFRTSIISLLKSKDTVEQIKEILKKDRVNMDIDGNVIIPVHIGMIINKKNIFFNDSKNIIQPVRNLLIEIEYGEQIDDIEEKLTSVIIDDDFEDFDFEFSKTTKEYLLKGHESLYVPPKKIIKDNTKFQNSDESHNFPPWLQEYLSDHDNATNFYIDLKKSIVNQTEARVKSIITESLPPYRECGFENYGIKQYSFFSFQEKIEKIVAEVLYYEDPSIKHYFLELFPVEISYEFEQLVKNNYDYFYHHQVIDHIQSAITTKILKLIKKNKKLKFPLVIPTELWISHLYICFQRDSVDKLQDAFIRLTEFSLKCLTACNIENLEVDGTKIVESIKDYVEYKNKRLWISSDLNFEYDVDFDYTDTLNIRFEFDNV